MNVTEHRPVYKRVDLAARPARPAEAAVVDVGWEERYVEQQRVWGLVRQSAEGCNQAAAPPPSVEEEA